MSTIAVGVGPVEIGIVLLIVLIIFGPKRIPELGRSLGSGMRGFKEAVTGKDKGDDDEQERLDESNAVPTSASEPRRDGDPATAGRTGDTRS